MVIDSLKSEYRFYDEMTAASFGYGQGSATTMTYSASGRLCRKLQPSTLQDLVYGYSQTDRQHAPRRILNSSDNTLNDLLWEATGCLGVVSSYDDHMNFNAQRQLHWTEDCRLSDVADMEFFSHYGYDSEGTRWLKMTGASSMQVINGDMATCMANLNNVTLYASPYLVATNAGYTKHYYAGTERVAARVGNGGLVYSTPFIAIDTALRGNADRLFARCMASMSQRHIQPNNPAVVSGLCNNNVPAFNLPLRQSPSALSATVSPVTTAFASAMESCAQQSQAPEAAYYYHSDHLGGAAWITDGTGQPVQHLQYYPFGEPFVNQRATGSTYSERYTFTGKERDSETGYSDFGARYMDHALLTSFMSVDPLTDKYPGVSPYAYCAWNPVKIIDPNGDSCKFSNEETKSFVMQLLDPTNKNYSLCFAEKYYDLEADNHNYLFSIWEGDKNTDGEFKPKSLGDNTSQILFTNGETSDTKNSVIGMSKFKILFEETFHAWKYKENDHSQYPTCYSEALAWKFSAMAPGTKHFYGKELNATLMGHVFCTAPEILALEFKSGFFDLYGGKALPAPYPHLELYPNNRFRRNMGLPEWH